jgi:hypothetical protein
LLSRLDQIENTEEHGAAQAGAPVSRLERIREALLGALARK